jgi:hypothetical protein
MNKSDAGLWLTAARRHGLRCHRAAADREVSLEAKLARADSLWPVYSFHDDALSLELAVQVEAQEF